MRKPTQFDINMILVLNRIKFIDKNVKNNSFLSKEDRKVIKEVIAATADVTKKNNQVMINVGTKIQNSIMNR